MVLTLRRAGAGLAGLVVALALALGGCTSPPGGPGTTTVSGLDRVVVGTTDQLTMLDPAGAYDRGTIAVQIQVFSFLYSFVPSQSAPQPDAAESCAFAEPTVFECHMRPGLKFANGHDLTSSDVKFSFDRIVRIADPNGPLPLLANLDHVEAPDPATVRFYLKAGGDQTFQQVLATSAGPIVDEQVFPADSLLPDNDIVAAQAFSGPYTISAYRKNDTIDFTPYAGYVGALAKPVNTGVVQKTFADATNLRLSISTGNIDVAFRWLSPTDIEALGKDPRVRVWTAPSSVIRFLVFNLKTMPGATDAQKLAIRQAVAATIDRKALATQVYKGQFTPLCSFIPDGYVGATTAVCDEYGSVPDRARAARYLSDAGVGVPVTLNIQYNRDHYGVTSEQEYGLIKQQLEATGLFKVDLQTTEWVTYNKARVRDAYPVFQLGWGPDFPDSDSYLTPLYLGAGFMGNHYESPAVAELINQQRTETDPVRRAAEIGDIQTLLATDLPAIPLLRSTQWTVSLANVTGIELGVDEGLHFNTITKS